VALRESVLAVAAALAAAACEAQALDPGGTGAAGTNGTAGVTGSGGTTGFGGDLGGIGGVTGVGGGQQCGAVPYSTQPIPPDILILLDASGSMNNDTADNACNNGCGATSKWAQAMPAINAVVAETQDSIRWGLKFFADTDATCGVGNSVAVPVAIGNAGAIENALFGRTSANGGLTNGSRTPTRAAENAGEAYLVGLTDPSPKFLLLVTDGLPNCTPGSSDTAADDSTGTVAAVTAAAAAGIPTMVVGVSTSGVPGVDATLNDMAVAGGYARASSPAYYPASSTDQLTAALRALANAAPSCMFALPPAPNSYLDPYNIGVVVGGVSIPRDTSHANGWDYTGSGQTAIEIYGSLCDDIKTGTVTSVQIVFHCPIG
jgi:hypothetical protein